MKSHNSKSVLESLGDALRCLEAIVKGGVPTNPYSTQGSSRPSSVLRNMGKTLSIPMFKGDSHREFITWLFEVECYFSEYVCSDEESYDLVAPCLTDYACLWYSTLKLSRMLKGDRKIRTWIELRALMREKYLPSHVLNDLSIELRNLRQNSMSINEYARVFEELHLAIDDNVCCVQKGVRFYHGLNDEISSQLDLTMKYSFLEIYQLALFLERGHNNNMYEAPAAEIVSVDKEFHLEPLDLSHVNSEKDEYDFELTCGENLSPFTTSVVTEIKRKKTWDVFHDKGVIKGDSSKCDFLLSSQNDLKMFNDKLESGKDKFQQEHTYCSNLKNLNFDTHNLNLSEKHAELLHEEKGLNSKVECEGERRSNVILAWEDWDHKGIILYQIDQRLRGTPNQPKEPCKGCNEFDLGHHCGPNSKRNLTKVAKKLSKIVAENQSLL